MDKMSNFLFLSTVVLVPFWLVGVLSGSGIVPGVVVLLTLGFLLLSETLNSGG